MASLFEDVAREYIKLTESSRNPALNNSSSLDNAEQAEASEPHSDNNNIEDKDSNQTLTQRDPLTELPNRVFFSEYVDQAIKRAARHNKPFALVFIDIDHFKTINDTHGHQIGDAILIELAQRIKEVDLVITGEGRLDAQTIYGKTPVGVAKIARQFGVPVIAIAGGIEGNPSELYQAGITAMVDIIPKWKECV